MNKKFLVPLELKQANPLNGQKQSRNYFYHNYIIFQYVVPTKI